jgi:hypothetical protein
MTSPSGKRRTLHRLLPVFVALAAAWTVRPPPAQAATPAAVCARIGTDDTLRPIPESLVPAVNAAFGTAMPARLAMDATVFRCATGRVLVCTTGANLPCGRANTSRTPGPGAVAWCRDHPNAAFIPTVATGHDTIFAWRCQGDVPQAGQQLLQVDPRGFIATYWQMLP